MNFLDRLMVVSIFMSVHGDELKWFHAAFAAAYLLWPVFKEVAMLTVNGGETAGAGE